MDELPKLSELQDQGEKNRVDFLQTDLALCFTFADLVRTELQMDDREAAARVLARAEQGFATIASFVSRVEDAQKRDEIQQTLTELRATLDGLSGLIDVRSEPTT